MGAGDGRAIVEHWYTCLTPTQFTTASCGCFWSLLGTADGRAIVSELRSTGTPIWAPRNSQPRRVIPSGKNGKASRSDVDKHCAESDSTFTEKSHFQDEESNLTKKVNPKHQTSAEDHQEENERTVVERSGNQRCAGYHSASCLSGCLKIPSLLSSHVLLDYRWFDSA